MNGIWLVSCLVAAIAIRVVWFFWLHHDLASRVRLTRKISNVFTLTQTYLKNADTYCILMSEIKPLPLFCFLLFL